MLIVDAADPAPGSTVLVNGASGGVGTFVIQLAKVRRLHVTAVVSARNVALAKSLGADRVIDDTVEDFTLDGVQHDVVVDLVGNRACASSGGPPNPAGPSCSPEVESPEPAGSSALSGSSSGRRSTDPCAGTAC